MALTKFFDALGPERCQKITHVSADAAAWIKQVVTEKCPNAVRCAHPFHVVAWATDMLDEVRRGVWNDARKQARQNDAKRGPDRPAKDAPARPDSERVKSVKVPSVRY